jgi:hypothetical protein
MDNADQTDSPSVSDDKTTGGCTTRVCEQDNCQGRTNTMIAAIYCRKSTDQTGVADEQKSVARQVEHARAYAQRKGWTVADNCVYVTTRANSGCVRWRTDVGRSLPEN